MKTLNSFSLRKEPGRILIVKPSALGDIVHSLPFLNALKGRFPGAHIHWVVSRGFHELLEFHPMLSRLWIIDKNKWKQIRHIGSTIQELRSLGRNLKAEGFDLAIDLQGLFRSGLITQMSGAPIRVGFKEAREGSTLFYSHTVEGGSQIHAVDRYLKIASFLGCDTKKILFPLPPGPENPLKSLSVSPPYAVMAPSAGKRANRWPAERFGELASRLPIPVVVISGKHDAPVAETVVRGSRGNAVSLAGRTGIKEMIAVIRDASFFISNDTGPMHIAAAFNIPVFAVFGPANPVRTGPYGSSHTVVREDLPCSPCYAKRKCSHWTCMDAISVDRVLAVILEKLHGSNDLTTPSEFK